MIKYNREHPGVTPPSKLTDPDKKRENDLELEQMHNNNKKMEFKKTKYGSNDIKKELLKITHSKCGYCENKVSITYYGDVDHYRPKSKYWWLAYTWENFIPTCKICNSKYKSDSFPTDGTPAQTPDDDLTQEKPLLIHPFDEDPEEYIRYEIEPDGVYIRPKNPTHQNRINACEKYYGINRETLVEDRLNKLIAILFTISVYQNTDISQELRNQAKNTLIVLSSPRAEYSGMARYYLEQENITLN